MRLRSATGQPLSREVEHLRTLCGHEPPFVRASRIVIRKDDRCHERLAALLRPEWWICLRRGWPARFAFGRRSAAPASPDVVRALRGLELARALSSLSRPSLAVAGCVNSTTDLQEDAQMVTLTGNGGLTKDPELRHTSAGKAVATVSVAAGVPAERARAAQAARPGRVGLPCPSATAGLGHHGRPDAPGSTGPTIRLRAIQAPVREARYLTLTRCGRCSFSPSMTAAAGSRPPSRATSTRSPTV